MRTQTKHPLRPLCALATLICTAAPMVAFTHGKPQHPPQLSPARPATLIGGCEALQSQLTGLPNTVVTGSSTVAAGTLQVAGQPVPEHCRVTGRMNDRIGLDGRPYAIGFELRLPVEWNGRFWYQGNGGIDGSVVPATGALGGGPLTHALAQGFAVLSSDAGHPAAYGPSFGFDPQSRLDYGYQAVGTLTPMAKAAITRRLRKGTGPLVHRRLLERWPACAGRGGSICRPIRRLPRRRAGFQSTSGGIGEYLECAALRKRRHG